jgi:hypothetical protein
MRWAWIGLVVASTARAQVIAPPRGMPLPASPLPLTPLPVSPQPVSPQPLDVHPHLEAHRPNTSGSIPADNPSVPKSEPPPKATDERVLADRVRSVHRGRVELEHDPEPVYLDHSSTLLVHGRVAPSTELRPGDEVRASLDLRNGHRVVRTMSVLDR